MPAVAIYRMTMPMPELTRRYAWGHGRTGSRKAHAWNLDALPRGYSLCGQAYSGAHFYAEEFRPKTFCKRCQQIIDSREHDHA